MSETSWNNFGRRKTGHGVDSMYQLIAVAAQRNKQLVRGAAPRISVGPMTRRSTTIALEETRRGLVPFTTGGAEEKNSEARVVPSQPDVSAAADVAVQIEKETP